MATHKVEWRKGVYTCFVCSYYYPMYHSDPWSQRNAPLAPGSILYLKIVRLRPAFPPLVDF